MNRLVPRITAAAAALAVAGIAVALALGWLSAAIYWSLAGDLGAPRAALVTGALALGFAAATGFVGWLAWNHKAGAAASPPPSLAVTLGEALGREAVSLAQSRPGWTIGLALLGGVVVGAFPELRQAIGKATGLDKK